MVAETRVGIDDLIAPLFVREGIREPHPIESLPGIVQHTRESLRREVAELAALGIPGVILFGIPSTKDPVGSEAWNPEGIVQCALRDLRADMGNDIDDAMALAMIHSLERRGACELLAVTSTKDHPKSVDHLDRESVGAALPEGLVNHATDGVHRPCWQQPLRPLQSFRLQHLCHRLWRWDGPY